MHSCIPLARDKDGLFLFGVACSLFSIVGLVEEKNIIKEILDLPATMED